MLKNLVGTTIIFGEKNQKNDEKIEIGFFNENCRKITNFD
jgi:hypothetical protein